MQNSPLSPAEAASELLRRRAARNGIIAYAEYTMAGRYEAAEHHRLIAEKLEAVERGEIPRLMIFMPPRHGKSELASRRFPSWYLGRNPMNQIIAASYNSDLAGDFGREVRNIVSTPEYQALFSTVLAPDSKAANRWHTDAGGAYVAAGIGTSVTGRGANVLLIDDPVKDREEADSELRQRRVWDWYTSTAYTRLMPNGAIVLIMTRWNEGDLAGRLLDAMRAGGDQWDVLSLRALTDDGRALWPEWYPPARLQQIKAAIGPRDFGALYQQNPTPDEGHYFKRDWLRWYDEAPKHVTKYGASDYAVTEGSGDFTEHGVVGVDPDDNIYILDWWSGQTASDVWVETLLDMMAAHKPAQWAEEAGQINKSLGPFIERRQRERKVWCYRGQYTSTSDKPTRAQSFRGRMAMGKVYFPKNAPWVEALVSQMMAFPAGRNDDKVDVLGLIGRLLDQMISGRVPPADAPPRDSWADAFARSRRESEEDGWKVA